MVKPMLFGEKKVLLIMQKRQESHLVQLTVSSTVLKIVVVFSSCCCFASIKLIVRWYNKRGEYRLHLLDFFEKSYAMLILQNLHKIIAMHPKSPKNWLFFGENNYSLSENGQNYRVSPTNES